MRDLLLDDEVELVGRYLEVPRGSHTASRDLAHASLLAGCGAAQDRRTDEQKSRRNAGSRLHDGATWIIADRVFPWV